MDFSILTESWPLYLEGFFMTLQLSLIAVLCGLMMAVPFGVMQNSTNWWLRTPVWGFSFLFRGTPLLVQLFLLYHGLAQFDLVRGSSLWPYLREAYVVALIAFTLNTAAYTTEIMRGALANVESGQIEAGISVGMSPWQIFWRIRLPLAFRQALPSYGNEVIFMIHGTSLASVVTLTDITGAARLVNSRFYSPTEAFLTAGALYLAITYTCIALFKWLEKHLSCEKKPQPAAAS